MITASNTPEGQAGLDALLNDPAHALVASDFDGTLSPIVADPQAALADPGAAPALERLAKVVGTVAIITGRPVAEAVSLGGFAAVPGLIILGQYGAERWEAGAVTAPPPPPGIDTARRALPGILASAGAPDGVRLEDKGYALAVHTRPARDPEAALDLLRKPLAGLADRTSLVLEPGRLVLELRPPGATKGAALIALVTERGARSVLFAGDDLGDLPAFAAVRELRANGVPGCAVYSASTETAQIADVTDIVVDGPAGVVALFDAIAAQLGA